MLRKSLPWIILFLMAAFVMGCASLAPEATPVPPTKTPKPTFTPTPDWTPTPVVFPTATPLPATPTPEPTATPQPTPEPPTPTPNPVVRFSVGQTVNVRSGPGTVYPVIGRLTAGQSFEITGKNAAGDWLQFRLDGRAGWVTATLVSISGDLGTVQVAQNIPPPPTATPRPRPTATPVPPAAPPPTAAPRYPFILLKGVERCDPNAGVSYYEGFVRYRNNAPRNGVCMHTAFYGPRVTKCSGCDGVGDGVWGFSPFGGPAPAGITVEVYVVKCPPGPIPMGGVTLDTPGGFSTSDLTPLSEKWVHTFNQSEQCTGITFVGD